MADGPDQSRYGRLHGLVDYEWLGQRSVTCIGLGSMGQPVVEQLVRHAVGTRLPGRVRAIDGDHVTPRNLIGTGYRESDLGKPKAQAAAEILQAIDRNVNVSYWQQMLDHTHLDQVEAMAAESDLLILAADAVELMLDLADRCQGRCPIVMGVFGARADTAEAAYSIPGQTAPLRVAMGRRQRKTIEKPTALGCDTGYVAHFVAALCLRLLLGDRKGSELFPCYANAPLLLLGQRRTWIFEQQPDDVVRSIINVASPEGL